MSLRLSKKIANDTRYDGLVKTLRQESPGHLTGFLIRTVLSTSSEIGKKRKVPIPTIAPLGHIHIRNNTAKTKRQDSLASALVSKSPVAFKRPSENRNAASTSKSSVPTPRKRKHPTPSGSPDSGNEDSAPSRRKRFAAAVESTPSGSQGGQSTAPAHALSNKNDPPATTENLLSRPPLEEIEMWVPIPNAKFGPPKRKRTTGKRRDPPKEGPVDIAVHAKTPVPTPTPLSSLSRPLSLTKSQIVALREEEEESQSQSQSQSRPTSNQPGGTINDSATSDSLPPAVRDGESTANVSKRDSLGSLKRPMGQPSADIQPTNPNVNNGRDSEPTQGAYSPSIVPDPVTQVSGATDDSPGYRFNPLSPSPMSLFNPKPSASANSSSKSPQMEKSMQGEGVDTEDTYRFEPRIPVFNVNPSVSAISSSKSPQTEKSAKNDPPRNGNPDTSSIKQHSPSRSEPPRSGNGMLANRRALEARVRLNELRRAGKRFGIIPVKEQAGLETSQSSGQPPHVVFKRVMDGIESLNGSQVTQNSANEISASASAGADPSKSLVTNKMGQDAMGSLSRTGDLPAANVLVVRGDVTTRRTAPW